VPEFLSDEWLAALDASARAIGPLPAVSPFVLEQVVTSTGRDGTERDSSERDGDEVRYQLVFTADGLRVHPGHAEAPDVSFATDRETAAGIARGETNAQRALAAGRLRVHGTIEILVARAEALVALEDVFAAVRAGTTYR
jgi:SCP-2 sterol transfer family